MNCSEIIVNSQDFVVNQCNKSFTALTINSSCTACHQLEVIIFQISLTYANYKKLIFGMTHQLFKMLIHWHQSSREAEILKEESTFETVFQFCIHYSFIKQNQNKCTETRELVPDSFSAIYYHLAKQSFCKWHQYYACLCSCQSKQTH